MTLNNYRVSGVSDGGLTITDGLGVGTVAEVDSLVVAVYAAKSNIEANRLIDGDMIINPSGLELLGPSEKSIPGRVSVAIDISPLGTFL